MALNPITSFLTSEHSNTLVCTSAGVVGGVAKAVSTPYLFLNVTFDGSVTVATYAILSSVAAYLAKQALGYLHSLFFPVIRKKGGSHE
jgi:hypothetical protein